MYSAARGIRPPKNGLDERPFDPYHVANASHHAPAPHGLRDELEGAAMTKDTLHVSGVKYTTAEDGYLRNESSSGPRASGASGASRVAAVISGDFSGWNFGIDFAGFGGMLIAFAILVVMYYGLIFSIGEMASAMPHTGGAYSFSRAAMGPWGGFVTGLAETIEYVATTAVDRLLLRLVRRRASRVSCSGSRWRPGSGG